MKKGNFFLAVGVLIMITAVFFFETLSAPPVNWNDSFYKSDNIPLGSRIFQEALQAYTAEVRFKEVNVPVFEFLGDSTVNGTYVLFNRDLSWNSPTTHLLLDWVAAGNTVFMSASDLDEFLLDTLGLSVDRRLEFETASNSIYLDLVNPHLNPPVPSIYDREEPFVAFNKNKNTLPIQVLGRGISVSSNELTDWEKSDVNFVSVKIGEGKVLLHTFPAAFTNYFMLKEDNLGYIKGVLAYFPDEDQLYVDNYYKAGKSFYNSPLYVLLDTPSLKMAYYILLAMVVLWVLFVGKRQQAAIPIIPPQRNQTLAFVDTLSSMYLAKGDHKAMATHQTNYLFEYLRRYHYMGTEHRDEAWRRRLSEKYGEPLDVTEKAFEYIEELLKRQTVTTKELLHLNQLVTNYTHRHDITT